ncbi:MAG TPA: LytTR family DNA-binding domain-containing protein [Chitinophagaceae bacterium]|nr:LytTR family DNA-binding domain-containing protein [Chitinophagaceae bacterium]
MKLNCLIIDDEPIARKLLKEYIEETDFLEIAGVAENPLKAISLINSLQIDLIFLDINMPKMNGIEFLRSMPDLPMVILTTAYDQYALDGFELAVVDYLVKPFSLERFIKACQRALELKILKGKKVLEHESGTDYFFVKCDGKIEKVIYDELVYVEAMSNYIILHTTASRHIAYLTIKGMLESLPASKFIQVHKSFIVNADRVNSIEGNILHLGSASIPMGNNYVGAVLDRILKNRLFKR